MLPLPTTLAQISALVAPGLSSSWEGPALSTLGNTQRSFAYIKPPPPLQQLSPGLRFLQETMLGVGAASPLPSFPASTDLSLSAWNVFPGACRKTL